MNQTAPKKLPRRICLFGTSANPPTGKGGHVGLVEALVDLRLFDEVRILPVYRHTFDAKRNSLVDFSHRVAMCELAFLSCQSDATKVLVSKAEEDSFLRSSKNRTDEEKKNLRVGTADLLEMLLEDEPEATEFSFCLGGDTFLDLTDWKWKRSKDVFELLDGRLVVVNRKEGREEAAKEALKERVESVNATPLANGNILLLDVPQLEDVSSSKVRNSTDRDYAQKTLSPKVFEYMIAHKLYGFGVDNEKDDAEGTIIG